MITDKEILDYVENSVFDFDEIESGEIWRDYANESGTFQLNIWIDEEAGSWKATAYEDNFNKKTGLWETNFETNYRDGVTLTNELSLKPEPEKSPLENSISSVFAYGATLQKEINSLQGVESEEGRTRLNELVHEIQPRNAELLDELKEDKENGGYYLDNCPW